MFGGIFESKDNDDKEFTQTEYTDKEGNKLELSSAKLSSLSLDWVELKLSWSWNWVVTELGKYFNSSIEVFEVFN